MAWNWELAGWPKFEWNPELLRERELASMENAAIAVGTMRHLGKNDREDVVIELLSSDALSTSAIEGEVLDRDSVQSSLRRQLGLSAAPLRSSPAEAGIAEMMADLYRHPLDPITEERLFEWHRMVMNGRRDIADIGSYRRHDEPMQIVSGAFGRQRIHFEAPPSERLAVEMSRLLEWLEHTSPEGAHPLAAVTRAGIAHLWFESIHPFEDGNGRIGRAIAESALARAISTPTFSALSKSLLKHRRDYYAMLEEASSTLVIDDWLSWFADRALEAQYSADELVRFLIEKTRLMDRLRGALNERQEKVLLRMLAEGPEGFTGGLSAGNYATITGAPPSTITRDLADLVEKGALLRTGERKATRYRLNLATET
ncbi:Fic family protein [Rhizobium laguerreae]|uniref:Fic family protein n=1 Tax=Rhizobium laguerreae TaxID=1076926 RepID=UPI001C90E8C9|nr:Fic family protein [Rhizobium laguerreae]MBY3095697.1 Fic family protein [Rhizobium laguerreae]MBY3102513.1 Fic family protein [Rhizobium laguerreae]MBY3129966.1 Fic family protein [Rhizobium laguerreae]MBY3143671.1 Fic family protein [Rhizobium laguerreae]MBY3266660.1 Fic family protein [Rhizobium laguerreae]